MVLLVTGVVLLLSIDLRPWIESYASKTLGRRLTIGSVHVYWGNPLVVELRDLRLANPAWSSSPNLARVESASAEIDLWSLFSGPLRFEKLELINPVIALERNPAGTGNWRIRRASSKPSASPAPDRTKIPTFNHLAIRGGRVSYQASAGKALRIELEDLQLQADGTDKPLTITLSGAYNGQRGKLSAEGESFDDLRRPARPYRMHLSISNPAISIDLKGTLLDPLDFDGVKGSLSIKAQKLTDLLRILDAEISANFPIQFAGSVRREGNHWKLSDAQGQFAGSGFTGALALEEGRRREADDLSLDMAFEKLVLDPITGALASGGKAANWSTVPLHLEEKRGTNIAWRILADSLAYGQTHLSQVANRGHIIGGAVEIEQMKLVFAGGTINAGGAVKNVVGGGQATVQATLSGIDMAHLSKALGADAGQVTGKLDGAFSLDMMGDTLQAAVRTSRGHAVVGVRKAQIARHVIDRVSGDLLSFFRKREGMVAVSCVLGILHMKGGIGAIWPLRLRTPDGTLVGQGKVDVLRQRLDLTIKSDAASTSFFATDVPLAISGDFRNLKVLPATSPPAEQGVDPLRALPPGLRHLAERNPCVLKVD